MFWRTILALPVAALAFIAVARAQQSATLTLRNGDRITGQLLDLGGVGFTVRVNGAERNIPTTDVAVIDFSGGSMTDAEWNKVSGDNQVVWLKSGETVSGKLFDIGGTSPLKITFKTASGDREFSSSEIERIVFARPPDAMATSGANLQAPAGSGISINPKQPWTATGLTVRKGEVLHFNATGEIQLSNDPTDIATAVGAKSGRKAANSQMPNVLAGALIGRIGPDGQPFAIGSGVPVTMPAAGQLFLGINDDGFEDNQGEMRVDVTRQSRRQELNP